MPLLIRRVLTCFVLVFALASVQAQTQSRYPIADKLADKIIQRYRNSTCQQLAAEKQQPTAQKEAMEKKVIETLQNDPQMRRHFLCVFGKPAEPWYKG